MGIGIIPSESNYSAILVSKIDSETLKWHYRLGHLNIRSLNLMHTHDLVDGLPPLKSTLPLCEGCIFGKHAKRPYPTDPATQAQVPLALIHSDLCAPMSTPSLGGALYFLLFIDDFSRFATIYFLTKKSAVFQHFQEYKKLVENQFI